MPRDTLNNKAANFLLGDAAKRQLDEDEFGLTEMAKALANVVQSRITARGYAIGIQGEWGSGKTTLLNFVAQILSDNPQATHKVIRFEPWLVGQRDALLSEFFRLLLEALAELHPDKGVAWSRLIKRLRSHIGQYASYFDVGNKIVSSAAAFDSTGHALFVGTVLKILSLVARLLKKPPPTLENLKEQIFDDLENLKNIKSDTRITILIDDTDRLEPSESVEILRLVKSVANFPLITYLVCFDGEILATQVREVIKTGTGTDYVEKIFQQIVPLPPQEPFALRRFLRDKLMTLFPDEMSQSRFTDDHDSNARRELFFDRWMGALIKTPRDAVRLLDAIKLGWPYLAGNCDFIDYSWLQATKLKSPDLFSWITDYVVNVGSYRDGGRPDDRDIQSATEKLRRLLTDLGWETRLYLSGIDQFLPGLHNFCMDPTKHNVFDFAGNDNWSRFESGRRLGSPSHWRFYFAFEKPSYAIDDVDLASFQILVTHDEGRASAMLRALASKSHSIPGHHLDVFLDRLVDRRTAFSDLERVAIAQVFAEIMDDIPRQPLADFGGNDPWRKAALLLGPGVGTRFAKIVEDGRSINWLSFVMRDQGFALGRPNNDRARPDRQWLSDSEFDAALDQIIRRFKTIGLFKIFELPSPLDVLFCWQQLGNPDELRTEMAKAIIEDDELLRALSAMQTWVSSSQRGLYKALHSNIIRNFMDPDGVKQRLSAIQLSAQTTKAQKEKATTLLTSMDDL